MVHDSQDIITADRLRRTFRGPGNSDVVAVDDITMTIPKGQTVALLGPNGAGKTTLMRILSTLLPPTAGTAHIAGLDVMNEAQRVRSLIGYVGQGNSTGHNQRARDEAIAHACIYGADRATAARRAAELFTTFDLNGLEQRRTQEMSGGQRRRLDLAMGLVHHPDLLFLDEPTTGLDPQNRANLWDHIRQIHHNTNMTLVVTTHYLDEADSMAERILIVDHGRILADGTAQELKQTHVGSHVLLHTADDSAAQTLASVLRDSPEMLTLEAEHRTVTVRVSDAHAALPRLTRQAVIHGIDVVSASAHEPTLNDVFLTLTGRNLRDTTDTTQEHS